MFRGLRDATVANPTMQSILPTTVLLLGVRFPTAGSVTGQVLIPSAYPAGKDTLSRSSVSTATQYAPLSASTASTPISVSPASTVTPLPMEYAIPIVPVIIWCQTAAVVQI